MSVNETTSLVPPETRKAAASPRTSSGSAQGFSWKTGTDVVIPADDKLDKYEVRAHSIALRAHDHASHAPYYAVGLIGPVQRIHFGWFKCSRRNLPTE
jgi:hypothetical protein